MNDLNMKNAYRKKVGLLKSDEISGIREKYEISQKDFCILLGWGEKTITRYEGHQVQDKAHDSILRKIDSDSEWYISLLNDAKDNLAEEDKEILSIVIDKLGHMTKKEIVEFMHNEMAYKETAPKGIIEFRYAENLQI